MSEVPSRRSRPIPNRGDLESVPANGEVTTRKMTPEEWARTDLFKPSEKQFKVLDMHFEKGREAATKTIKGKKGKK